MALGIYKPGQGYWVRVMTAALIAIATFGAVGWLWGQAGSVAQSLDASAYVFAARADAGSSVSGPVAGDIEVYLRTADNERVLVGTAVVTEVRPSDDIFNLRVDEPQLEDDQEFGRGNVLVQPSGFTGSLLSNPEKIRPVEPLAIQAPVAALTLLIGAICAYWLVGHKPRAVDFLIATDMEMRKVNWSNRKNIIRSTGVVIGASFLIAGFLFTFDIILSEFFKLIGILR